MQYLIPKSQNLRVTESGYSHENNCPTSNITSSIWILITLCLDRVNIKHHNQDANRAYMSKAPSINGATDSTSNIFARHTFITRFIYIDFPFQMFHRIIIIRFRPKIHSKGSYYLEYVSRIITLLDISK